MAHVDEQLGMAPLLATPKPQTPYRTIGRH